MYLATYQSTNTSIGCTRAQMIHPNKFFEFLTSNHQFYEGSFKNDSPLFSNIHSSNNFFKTFCAILNDDVKNLKKYVDRYRNDQNDFVAISNYTIDIDIVLV